MDSAPDNIDSLRTRIENAKAFLKENPDEKIAGAAQIFGIAHTTLRSSIARDKKPLSGAKRGGHNKVLEKHQEDAILKMIRSLLASGIQPLHGDIFDAIVTLKRGRNPEYKGPSQRWFREWWKSNNLDKMEAEPLAFEPSATAEEEDIWAWFDDYREALDALHIKNEKNIVNFYKAGFRVGCMKEHTGLVPMDISELHAISLENRRSPMIFECVDAAGDFPPPPLIVIQGHEITKDWFPEGLPKGTRIMPSEGSCTSDELAMVFLQHYIEHSDSGPEADWKLMLVDNHGSPCTPEFIILANDNHIRPYPLVPHLTHCMQPLDVGDFQPYINRHDVAVQNELPEVDVEYTVTGLFADLTKIRDSTFKKSTIRQAFEKSGMWPLNAINCIQQHEISNPDIQKKAITEPTLSTQPRIHPKTPKDMEKGLEEWCEKVQRGTSASDPGLAEGFRLFVDDAKKLLRQATLTRIQLSNHRKRRLDALQKNQPLAND